MLEQHQTLLVAPHPTPFQAVRKPRGKFPAISPPCTKAKVKPSKETWLATKSAPNTLLGSVFRYPKPTPKPLAEGIEA